MRECAPPSAAARRAVPNPRRSPDRSHFCSRELIQEVRSRESRGLERPWAKKLKVRRPIDHRTPSSCATIAVPGCAAFQLYTNQHHCALNIPGVWGQSPQVIMPTGGSILVSGEAFRAQSPSSNPWQAADAQNRPAVLRATVCYERTWPRRVAGMGPRFGLRGGLDPHNLISGRRAGAGP